jgi:protein-S-isoprenylcysteine O-methyltransferase Ste14
MPITDYDHYGASTAQKAVFTLVHASGVAVGAWILIAGNGNREVMRLSAIGDVDPLLRALLLTCSLVYFTRLCLGLFLFMRRRMGWGEAIGFALWVATFHVGAAGLVVAEGKTIGPSAIPGVLLYLFGSYLDSEAERRRHVWKQQPANEGQLLTSGLYAWVRYPGYIGDVLALVGWALVTGSTWALLVPAIVLAFYVVYSIPMQETHLHSRYGESYRRYAAHSARMIPGIY